MKQMYVVALLQLHLLSLALAQNVTCDTSKLNSTTWFFPVTTNSTTIRDVAKATNRGLCDIGRWNLMADVDIIPSVGQSIFIPAQVCEPDHETCLLPQVTPTRNCIFGGPRLYYTVNGDTYERIALRLNITAASLMARPKPGQTVTTPLPPGQFVKVPQCLESSCTITPFQFKWGVYKDLAEKYGTTVGQIMMLSPTYSHSKALYDGGGFPSINMAHNCTAWSSNLTVLT